MNRKEKASFSILVGADLSGVQHLLEQFPERVKSSQAYAANKTARLTAVQLGAEISRKYNIGKYRVASAVEISRAKEGKNAIAVIYVGRGGRAKRLPLYEFSPHPYTITNPRPDVGVSVEYIRGLRLKIAGSFVADTPVRGLNLYHRQNDRANLLPDGRERIYKLVGMSVPQMTDAEIRLYISDYARRTFEKEFVHDIQQGFEYRTRAREAKS